MFDKRFYLLFIAVLFIVLLSGCKGDSSDSGVRSVEIDPVLHELNMAIGKDSGNAELFFSRARFYYEHEGYDEAIFDLAAAMKRDSMKPAYYHLLADTYLDYYQSRMALMTMQKTVGTFPDHIHSWLKLTEFQIVLKKYDEAMQSVQTILKKDPQNADAYIMMGTVLDETGDPKRAILAFKKATEIDPFLVDAWINTGRLADELNEKNAVNYFETAHRIDSVGIEPMYAMAMHYQKKNNYPKAIEWYKKINERYPNSPEPFFNIGVLYQEMDSLDRAMEYFDMATSVNMIYAEAYYAKGVIFEKKGETEKAWRQYTQASTLMPKFTEAVEAAARLKIIVESEKKN